MKNDTDIKPSPTPYSEMMLCLCLSLHKVDRSLVSRRYNGSTEIRVELKNNVKQGARDGGAPLGINLTILSFPTDGKLVIIQR